MKKFEQPTIEILKFETEEITAGGDLEVTPSSVDNPKQDV